MLASHRSLTADPWSDRTRTKVRNVSRASERPVKASRAVDGSRTIVSSRMTFTEGCTVPQRNNLGSLCVECGERSARNDTSSSDSDGWKVLPFGEPVPVKRSPFQKRDRYESLERILNTTTLTTQRIAHKHILDVGKDILSRSHVDVESEKAEAVKLALQEADEKHTQHLKNIVSRLKCRLDKEKEEELKEQKQTCQKMIEEESIRRDRLEEENQILRNKQFADELKQALETQMAEFKASQEAVIKESCDSLRTKLRQEFILEKELAIAEALARARENFKKKELEHISAAVLKCEQDKLTELDQLNQRHKLELDFQEQQTKSMSEKYVKLLTYSRQLENDFKELEMDYMRFLDQTDKYHSDYLLKPRFPRSAVNRPMTAKPVILD